MPTITAHIPATTATVVGDTSAADTRRTAAIAAIEGKPSTPSNIVQDGSGTSQEGGSISNPPKSMETSPEAIKSKIEVSGDNQRFSQLARREKHIRQQAQRLAAEKVELEKTLSNRMTKEEFTAQLRKDPTTLGMTYDDLGQLYLNQSTNQDPVVQRLQAQIEELKAGQSKAISQAEQAQQQAYSEALKQIDREAKTLVSKSDAYEVTRSQGAESAITKLIELTYQEEGVLMDVEEAATQVETYLEEQALSLFNRSNKLKAKLSPGANGSSTQAQMKQTNNTPQKQSVNTLTRSMEQASSKPLTRYERAVLAFQGKLKD